jgi:hypothetical protein
MGYKGTKTRSILRKCKECSIEFYEYKSRIEDGRGIFCSMKCRDLWKTKSEEFSNSVRDGVLKKYKEDKTYRKRVSEATIKAMADPLVREKCRNAPKLKGKDSPRYKERKYFGEYIIIKDNGKDKFEHRKVMEVSLDRLLTSEERVHHLNLNKGDNSITNLILFSNASNHKKFHDNAYKFIVKNNLLDQYINFFIKNGGECVKITR